MSDQARPPDDLPNLDEISIPSTPGGEDGFRPWEQRIRPGMGRGGGGEPDPGEERLDKLGRACQEADRTEIGELVDRQTDLIHYTLIDRQMTPETDLVARPISDQEAWRWFLEEQLYDTRRVVLQETHLFEWFPAAPGRFHTSQARQQRQQAYHMLEQMPSGVYFNPLGKASMIGGGVGAVRLRPRQVAGEPHYWMTASSSGVCHEGFPVLVPRRFYGPLKAQILSQGAVPVTLGGEMRYVPPDALTFSGRRRDIPLLYLHVDELQVLPRPRPEVTGYLVSAAVSFAGQFEGREGLYVTYASFDPADRAGFASAMSWLEKVYVAGGHQGVIVTDFDEVQPRFPDAAFGLPDLLAGRLDQERVRALLQSSGLEPDAGQPFFLIYREINTHGGAYIEGDVHVEGGDFIGRDQHR